MSDEVAPLAIFPLKIFSIIFYPIIFVFSRVARFLARLFGSGKVEQNFFMASSVGDHFHVMDDGMVVHSGVMEELVRDKGLKSKYLGISKAED